MASSPRTARSHWTVSQGPEERTRPMIIPWSRSRRRERGSRSQKSFLTCRGKEFVDRAAIVIPKYTFLCRSFGGSLRRHEPQIRVVEPSQVGKHRGHVRRGDPEPAGESGAVLVDRGGGDPAALAAGVVGTALAQGGNLAVDVAAADGAAQDHLVVAPAVVRAAAVAHQGAAEVRGGEGGDVVGQAELDR